MVAYDCKSLHFTNFVILNSTFLSIQEFYNTRFSTKYTYFIFNFKREINYQINNSKFN